MDNFTKTFVQTAHFRTEKENDNILKNVIMFNTPSHKEYVVKFDKNNKPISPIKSELHPNLEMKKIYDKAYNVWKLKVMKDFDFFG